MAVTLRDNTLRKDKWDVQKCVRVVCGCIAEPIEEFLKDIQRVEEIDGIESPGRAERRERRQILRKYRNCGGQYAMATVFKMCGIEKSLSDVISETNPEGIFTGPLEMGNYLIKNDISVTGHNKGSIDELARHVSKGKPAILLVNADTPDWIVVTGFEPNGREDLTWHISESAKLSNSPTYVGTIPQKELVAVWDRPFGKASLLFPHRRYWLAVGEGNSRVFKAPLGTVA